MQVQALRQRLDQERLPQAGHPFQEGVPPGKETGQDPADDLGVAHDDLPNLPCKRSKNMAKHLGAFFGLHGILRD